MKNNKKIFWRWKNDISKFKEDFCIGETEDRIHIQYRDCIARINVRKSEIEYYFPRG